MGSIIALPNDYVVVDLETTGLDYIWDDVIEIAAVRFRNGEETERYEQLISIDEQLPRFITELTGITDEMLVGCPRLDEVIQAFAQFLGSDIIIGHNVGFDIRFLSNAYQNYLQTDMENQHIDTMRFARKLLPELGHHRLKDLAAYYGITYKGAHRSGIDCDITNSVYQNLRTFALSQGNEADFQKLFAKTHASKANAKNIQATTDHFDPDHPLYQKTVVFTGALTQMTRAEAMQLVVNCGGICGNGVTKTTNYLVVGTSDYISAAEGKKTSKMLKVEQLRGNGFDIATISEKTFFDYIEGLGETKSTEQPNLSASDPNEEWVYDILLPTLKEILSLGNAGPDNLSLERHEQYSSVCYLKQDPYDPSKSPTSTLAFRIYCREGKHYFGISNTYLNNMPQEYTQHITNKGKNTGFTNFEFSPTTEGILHFSGLLSAVLDSLTYSLPKEFDCCSRFEQCSNAKKCIHPNPAMATSCAYRKVLKNGRVFHGDYRNTD